MTWSCRSSSSEGLFIRRQVCGVLIDVQMIGTASSMAGATPVPADNVTPCKFTTIRSALQYTEPNVPRTIFGIVLKKEIHAAYQHDEGAHKRLGHLARSACGDKTKNVW